MSWVSAGPGGLTYWFWSRYLPDDDPGPAPAAGLPGRFTDIAFNTVLGALFLLTHRRCCAAWSGCTRAVAPRPARRRDGPALRQQVSELTQSRTAAGEAEVHTLRRLERDLHDGPQQRLVRLGMDISAAQRRLADDPERANVLLDEAFQQSQDALAEIRSLSRGIAPPILAEQGLRAAVTALAARGSVATSVDVEDVSLSRSRPERGLLRGRRGADQRGEAQRGPHGSGRDPRCRRARGGQRGRRRRGRRLTGQGPRARADWPTGWPGSTAP